MDYLLYDYIRRVRRHRAVRNVSYQKRCRQAIRRRQAFAQKQMLERLMFVTILTSRPLLRLLFPPVRSLWVRPRSGHWWEHVASNFTTPVWLENFRLSRATFNYICDELRAYVRKVDTLMRKAICVERRVAIVLWFLSTGSDFRTVGHLFGVSKSTVCLVVKEVCSCIVTVLLPKYICMPSGSHLKKVVDGFDRDHGFPQCCGAVDGTHIPIVSPQECPADYYNRKGWHSILMQGTVDNIGRFIDVYVGWPGRVHDARVFANSSLYSKGQSHALLPNWTRQLGPSSRDVPLVLLGDPAYPLLEWLMKAFPDTGHLTPQQRYYNYRLSKARVVVEHAYGRLKGRWRCLMKRLDIDVMDVPELVLACCVLHNVCIMHGEDYISAWDEDSSPEPISGGSSSAHQTAGTSSSAHSVDIRNTFMSYFEQQRGP